VLISGSCTFLTSFLGLGGGGGTTAGSGRGVGVRGKQVDFWVL
jgi:hypothetical protein